MLSRSKNKYPHAWQNGKLVTFEQALNNYLEVKRLHPALEQNQDKRFYYTLDTDGKIPLQNNFNGEAINRSKFWSLPGHIYIDGVKYKREHTNESYEHRTAKLSIIKNGFFIFKNRIVNIKNAKEEVVFDKDNKYRADVKAELMDGTPVIIEVVKTSRVKQNKQDFIKQIGILTFIINIDNEGNQQHSRDTVFGDLAIEEGRARIIEIRARKSNSINGFREQQRKTLNEIAITKGDIDSITHRIESERKRIQSKYEVKYISSTKIRSVINEIRDVEKEQSSKTIRQDINKTIDYIKENAPDKRVRRDIDVLRKKINENEKSGWYVKSEGRYFKQ